MVEESKRVNKSELAKLIGKSKQYIGKIVKEGKLVFESDGKIDFEVAKKQLANNQERVKPSNDIDPDNDNLNYYKTQTEKYKSQITEIELQKKRGELLQAEDVKRDAYTVGKKLNNSLLSIPERISNILAVESDPLKIRNLLSEEIRLCLSEVSDDLEGFVKAI